MGTRTNNAFAWNSHDSQILNSHSGIWITRLIGRTEVDLDCSLQAIARCCRQIMCHIKMTEWAQAWLGSACRPCQYSSQWQHAVHMLPDQTSIKRSEIGYIWYKGHASSRKLWILYLSNILRQNCSMPTQPPNHHHVSQGEVLLCCWLAHVAKNRKQRWYFVDLNPGARLKNKCIVWG